MFTKRIRDFLEPSFHVWIQSPDVCYEMRLDPSFKEPRVQAKVTFGISQYVCASARTTQRLSHNMSELQRTEVFLEVLLVIFRQFFPSVWTYPTKGGLNDPFVFRNPSTSMISMRFDFLFEIRFFEKYVIVDLLENSADDVSIVPSCCCLSEYEEFLVSLLIRCVKLH